MNTKYYISTGAQECFYTLRYSFSEPYYIRTETGVENAGSLERDYHVRNLSTDREQAIAKAREITGLGLSAEFEVRDITRRSEVDWSVFQAGKYAGKSIHEIATSDRDYLCWICDNLATSKSYAKTVELVRALVVNDLAFRSEELLLKTELAEIDRQKFAAAAAKIAGVINGCSRQPGDFCSSIAAQLAKGQTIRGRAHSLVLDIYAKAHGRRNSQTYQAAYEEAWQILGEECAR